MAGAVGSSCPATIACNFAESMVRLVYRRWSDPSI
jgi:hypothetical protein